MFSLPSGNASTRILLVLVCALFSLRCSVEPIGPGTRQESARPSACGQAEMEAQRLAIDSNYEGALDRYGDALDLCAKSKKRVHGILASVASIADGTPAQCQRASELFQLVPPSEDIDYLRPLAMLHYSCFSAYLDHLADVESETLYGSQAPALRQLVWEYEHAYLFIHVIRNRRLPEHLWYLKRTTLEFCREDLLPLAIRTLEQTSDRVPNPLGAVWFWTLPTWETLDEETKSCLGKVAAAMEKSLDRFSPIFRDQ